MKINQPIWKCVAQLGDVNPIEHGGHWVFTDTTGVCCPESEILSDNGDGSFTVSRYLLEKCTYINGILSDNKFHPDKSAWFETAPVASYIGMQESALIALFCSDNPIDLARAYEAVTSHYGVYELDQDPLTLTYKEAQVRYKDL